MSEVARTGKHDFLLLLTDDVAASVDLGAYGPHHYDPDLCFLTCASTWREGRAQVLRTLDIWSADSVLQGHTVHLLTIENVLIGLPFVARLFHRYGYSAVIQPHKSRDAGSHGRFEVRFIINSNRGWGGYVYHGVERCTGMPRLYRTVIRFETKHTMKIKLLRQASNRATPSG